MNYSRRILHIAEIVLPMGGREPIADGAVVVDEMGRVLDVGSRDAIGGGFDERYHHAVIMPGVLNCHVHLTDARRAAPVPGGAGLNNWVRGLLSLRNAEQEERASLADAVIDTLGAMRDAGTVAVGEVANNFDTLEPVARSGMRCRFIHELIGFRSERADDIMRRAIEGEESIRWSDAIRHTLGAHAPYSVSPALLHLIEEHTARRGAFFHQHLAEDPDERLLFEEARGPWRDYLEHVGAWDPAWKGMRQSPIAYYDELGLLNDRFIAVHLANATASEIRLLAGRGVRAILSPSSNLHITGALPPLDAIAKYGMRFAFGTDGRGSNASIDVIGEARLLWEQAPELSAGRYLDALTSAGAEILQFEELGTIGRGARPGLLSVEVDAATDDLRSLERQILTSPASKRALH